ncbi:MAG: ornithine carbamoyltransferase [Chloroflexi bacterium]|nr:ornithine carbamoyltransferase [Chloroflexota bacterium]
MKKKDFLSLTDFTSEQLRRVLKKAAELKRATDHRPLEGKTLALLFQKPSLRTRVSFDVGMGQLGGRVIYLSPDEVGLGQRESVADVARVLSRYVDVIAARTFRHEDVEALARHATVPVINALSDREHPCQALADLLTVQEKTAGTNGRGIAYVGDGNNVAASLALAAVMSGADFRIASPEGYDLPEGVVAKVRVLAAESKVQFQTLRDPKEAVRGADVVYTDVWTSMGQEEERKLRLEAFAAYQVTEELLAAAKPGAILMHPLPAHEGEEVAAGLVDHPASVVFDQAENRLHAQKALLIELLGEA